MLQFSVNLPELRDMAKKILPMGTAGLMGCEIELFLCREIFIGNVLDF